MHYESRWVKLEGLLLECRVDLEMTEVEVHMTTYSLL